MRMADGEITVFASFYLERTQGAGRNNNSGKWQGRLDSNQRMAGSKPAALPLGDAPVVFTFTLS